MEGVEDEALHLRRSYENFAGLLKHRWLRGCGGLCQIKRSHRWRSQLLLVLGVLVGVGWPLRATANSWPPAAIWLLNIPLGSGVISYGIGLVAIALLESRILSKREQIPWRQSIKWVAIANIVSLVIGLILVVGLAALPYSIVGLPSLVLLWIALTLASLSTVPHFRLPTLESKPALWWTGRSLLWAGVWLIALGSTPFLISGINALNINTLTGTAFPDPSVSFGTNALQLFLVMVFVTIGFALSIVSEHICLVTFLKTPTPKYQQIWATVWIMNLRSYGYIAIPLTLFFLIHQMR